VDRTFIPGDSPASEGRARWSIRILFPVNDDKKLFSFVIVPDEMGKELIGALEKRASNIRRERGNKGYCLPDSEGRHIQRLSDLLIEDHPNGFQIPFPE